MQQLCRIAQMAGDEIMAVYGQDVAVHEKPDKSPLTAAILELSDESIVDLNGQILICRTQQSAFNPEFIAWADN